MSTNAEQVQEPVLVVGDNFFVIGANESFSDSPLLWNFIDVVTEEIVCDHDCDTTTDEYALMYEGCRRPLTGKERNEHREREKNDRKALLSNNSNADSSIPSPVNETLLLPQSLRQPSVPKRVRKDTPVADGDLLMNDQQASLEPVDVQTPSVIDSGENGVPASERPSLLFSMENILAASEEVASDSGHAFALILNNPEAPPAPKLAPLASSPQQLVAQQTGLVSVEPVSTETAPRPVEKESTLPSPSTILKNYYERLSYVLPILLSSEVPSPSTSSSSESSGQVEAIDLSLGNRSLSDEVPQEVPIAFGAFNPPLALPSNPSPWMVPGINSFAPPLGTLTPIAPPANPVAHHPLSTHFFRDMLKRMQTNRQDEVNDEPARKKQRVTDVPNVGEIPPVQTPGLNDSVQEMFNMNLQSIQSENIPNETLEDVMKCISLGDTQEANYQLNLITKSIINAGPEGNEDTNAANNDFGMGDVESGDGSTGIQEEDNDLDIETEQDNYPNVLDSLRSRSVSVEKEAFHLEDSEELKQNYGQIEGVREAQTLSELEAVNALVGLSETPKDMKKKQQNPARKTKSRSQRNRK